MPIPKRVRPTLTFAFSIATLLTLGACSKSSPDTSRNPAPAPAIASAATTTKPNVRTAAAQPATTPEQPTAEAPARPTAEAPARPTAEAPARPTAEARALAEDTLPTAWPEATALMPIRADQLLARIRARNKKGTLVNAWASWCGPCREELPMLASLAKNLAASSIDVVLVSVDEPEDHAKAEAFLKSFQITLPAYLAARPLGPFKEGLNPRWPGMLPATFLFDQTPRLRYFWGGEAFENEIVKIVDGFLAGKPIDGEANFALAPGATTP
ncbi:MAG: redoxin domain-containing protein [Myxococcota bacterium]